MSDEVLDFESYSDCEIQFRLLLSSAFRARFASKYLSKKREKVPRLLDCINAVARIRMHDALQHFKDRTYAATWNNLREYFSLDDADIGSSYAEFCTRQSACWIDVDSSAFYKFAFNRFVDLPEAYRRTTAIEYLMGFLAGHCDSGALGKGDFGFHIGTGDCEAFMIRLLEREYISIGGKSTSTEWVGVVAGKCGPKGIVILGAVPCEWIPESDGLFVYPCPSSVFQMIKEMTDASTV